MASRKRLPPRFVGMVDGDGNVIDDTAYFESRRIEHVHRMLAESMQHVFRAARSAPGVPQRGMGVESARRTVAGALRLLDEELERERERGYEPRGK